MRLDETVEPSDSVELPKRVAPTAAVTRQLWLSSGNRCAFTSCTEVIMDSEGTLLGEVAHIRSPVPGGPRFDATRSNNQSRAFDNLLLLCAKHHKIVDTRVDEWPVERLEALKVDHEKIYTGVVDQLRQMVGDITSGDTPQEAKTGEGLDLDLTDDQRAETVTMLNALCQDLRPVPVDTRTALALIIEVSDGVDIPLLVLASRADIDTGQLMDHLKILEHYRLVYINVPTSGEDFEPSCNLSPTHQDAIAELRYRAESTPGVVNRVIVDLDFTVFDEV